MLKKLIVLVIAVAAIAVAVFSYTKYYARKDVSRMVTEARLTAAVKTALALNRHLKGNEIEVSVSDNIVSLSGTVASDIEKSLAEKVALSIKDVDKVSNGLVVNRALALRSEAPERTLGEKLDDLTIEASVKTALLLNENVSGSDIKVDSVRGRVTLTGKIPSPAEAELARKITDDIEGVTSVRIKLQIEGAEEEVGKKPIIEKVDDARIVTQVRAALMVNRNIDASEIEVSSAAGIVTLTGITESGAQKELAQKIAEDCWGVHGVVNEIRVK